MSAHVIKKSEYTSNIWFQVDNTINESCFDRLFAVFENCEFTNVPGLTIKELVEKLQKWECLNSNRKVNPSCISYGATIELMLPEESSVEVMQNLCDRFVQGSFDGYPYYATFYTRGSAVCLFFWVFTRQYYENEKVECRYYGNDVYTDAKTGRICRKEDENAVLKHKKGVIKKGVSTQFSLIKARFFLFTKKKFKEFRERIIENVISVFVAILATRVVHEVSLPKFSLNSVHQKHELVNIVRVMNPKVQEIEKEVNEIYGAMICCGLQNELKKEFNIEIVQRIKNILRAKAFHRGNMKKPLKFNAAMNTAQLEMNLQSLVDDVKELKIAFFDQYFTID